MARLEDVARGHEVDRQLVGTAGLDRGSAARSRRGTASAARPRPGSATRPSGSTSQSFATKSASAAEVAANSTSRSGPGHLERRVERLRAEAEHVGALLQRALVRRPRARAHHPARHRGRPADRRRGVARVEVELVGRLVVRRLGRQAAAARAGASRSTRARASGHSSSSRQRLSPITKIRTGAVSVGGVAAQVLARRSRAGARRGRRRPPRPGEAMIGVGAERAAVPPRPDQERGSFVAQPDEVLERAAEEDVVPAADVEDGHAHARIAMPDRERLPVLVVGGMGEPLAVHGAHRALLDAAARRAAADGRYWSSSPPRARSRIRCSQKRLNPSSNAPPW